MNRKFTTLLAVSVLAACAETDTASPELLDEAQLNADVALVVADQTLGDLSAAQAHIAAPGDRAFDGERNTTVTFYDADGVEQDAYDALLTATIVHSAELSRSAERVNDRGTWSATVNASRTRIVSGLEGEETSRTINGTSERALNRSSHTDENGSRSYDMTSSAVWTDVVHGLPRDENPYPLSGTVTTDVTVVIVNGPNGDETRTRSAVLVFNGTQFAELTVDGETFEVDLSTRSGRSPFRPRGNG